MPQIHSNILPQWRTAVEHSKSRITVLTPYLTDTVISALLDGRQARIFTLFKVMDFASGASDLCALPKLLEQGHTLYELPNLHAKVVMDEDGFVTLGSQNVTHRGQADNLELSVLFDDPTMGNTCNTLRNTIEQWLPAARQITAPSIKNMELKVAQAKKLYNQFDKACEQLQREFEELDSAQHKSIKVQEQSKRRKLLQESREKLQKTLRNSERASTVKYATVSEYSGVTPFLRMQKGGNLLDWDRNGQAVHLTPGKRHLCVLESGEFGWARLAGKQITRTGIDLYLSTIIPQFPSIEVLLSTKPGHLRNTPLDTNLVALLSFGERPICSIPMNFTLAKLKIGAAKAASRSKGNRTRQSLAMTEQLIRWLNTNKRAFHKLMESEIVESFEMSSGKTYGEDASDFFGEPGQQFVIGVVFWGEHAVLEVTPA